MDFVQWPGWKFLLLVLIVASFWGLLFAVAGFLPSLLWISSPYWVTLTRIIFAILISMTAVIFFKDIFPELDYTQDILDELSIHAEWSIFWISLFSGVNTMFLLGFFISPSWHFWIALVIGGTLFWHIIAEFFLCIWAYGIEGISEFFHSSQILSFSFLLIIAFAIILSGYFLSLAFLPGIEENSLPKTKWEEIQQFLGDIKETLQKSWKETTQENQENLQNFPHIQKKIEEKIKQLDLKEMQAWLEKLHTCKTSQEIQLYLDSLEEYIQNKKK